MKKHKSNNGFRDDICGKFVFTNPVSGKDSAADDLREIVDTSTPLDYPAPEIPQVPAVPQKSSGEIDRIVEFLKGYWWLYLIVALYLIFKKN